MCACVCAGGAATGRGARSWGEGVAAGSTSLNTAAVVMGKGEGEEGADTTKEGGMEENQ